MNKQEYINFIDDKILGTKDLCPECNEGYLVPHNQIIKNDVAYFGKCNRCGYSEGSS